MNIHRKTSRLTAGLLLVAALPQVVWAQGSRADELLVNDANGFILTSTAVLVVFSALVMLVIVFSLTGRLMHRLSQRKAKDSKSSTHAGCSPSSSSAAPNGEAMVAIALALDAARHEASDETVVAISMALRTYLEQQHDQESFVLTLNPYRRTAWNARSLGMRQYNY